MFALEVDVAGSNPAISFIFQFFSATIKMLKFPRRTKYKQQHKLRIARKTFSMSSSQLNYGLFGLKALKNNRLEFKQMEACRRVLTRSLKKTVKIQFRVSPL
jgi:ribosomal protein L16/L10AE